MIGSTDFVVLGKLHSSYSSKVELLPPTLTLTGSIKSPKSSSRLLADVFVTGRFVTNLLAISLIGFKSFLVENDEEIVAAGGKKKSLVDLYAASTNGLDALNGEVLTSLSDEVLDKELMLGEGVRLAGEVKAGTAHNPPGIK